MSLAGASVAVAGVETPVGYRFKVAATGQHAPAEAAFLTLDADNEWVPTDWYLRLAGETQRELRGAPLAAGDLPFPVPPRADSTP